MAKLNGVKTLDMVNGEITKVSYEGAEYAAINTFGESKEGDLLYSKNYDSHYVSEDSFYAIIGNANGSVRFIDNYKENGFSVNATVVKAFRKISADKPTLEQRVEVLESDVAALKGEKVAEETIEFEGATYRKVDREAREGDVFIINEDNGKLPKWFTVGKPYKVLAPSEKEPDKVTVIADDDDDLNVYHEGCGRTRETVDVYEPIEQAKKVASEPKLKAGDYVKFKRSIDDTKAGKPHLIEVDPSDGALSFKDDAGDFCDIDFTGEYEILSAEEAKWAKIGRKPNEFKKGDVVKARTLWIPSKDINDHIGIIEDVGYEMVGIKFGNGRYCGAYIADGNVELFATVESLFNA